MRRTWSIALLGSTLIVLAAPVRCLAQQAATPPGQITSGATGVLVDGRPAARVGDTTTDGKLIAGAKGVFINGKPVAVVGGATECGGRSTSGSRGVFVNGKPMARAGDTTSRCK